MPRPIISTATSGERHCLAATGRLDGSRAFTMLLELFLLSGAASGSFSPFRARPVALPVLHSVVSTLAGGCERLQAEYIEPMSPTSDAGAGSAARIDLKAARWRGSADSC